MHLYVLQSCPSSIAQYQALADAAHDDRSGVTPSASNPSEEPQTKRHKVSIIILEKLLVMYSAVPF